MRLLLTGAATPLGRLAAAALRAEHDLLLTDFTAPEDSALPVTVADLRDPEVAAGLVAGCDAVLHLAPYGLPCPAPAGEEREVLDRATTGTFVLLHAAKEAGVREWVQASRLDLFSAYPSQYRIDETWEPKPDAEPGSLAPWLAELTTREFARAEDLRAICLRFGPLGDAREGTTEADAVAALKQALAFNPGTSRHHWFLYHLGSGSRYPLTAAAEPPFSFQRLP